MDNLEIYNRVRSVPENAQKTIGGGRLKGMTDINPMWRIKALTEVFGPCGVGWKYAITDKRLETAPDGTVAAFLDIDLYIRQGDGWSDAIPGTGGSMFISNERGGLYVSDECFKMALTDAISVACKALGMAADVYWDKDRTKYDRTSAPAIQPDPVPCSDCGAYIGNRRKRNGEPWHQHEIVDYSQQRFGRVLCPDCMRKAQKAEHSNGA